MELRRDLLTTVGVLVGMNVFLAFGAIGLFTRMSPAIERILVQNVASLDAAEEMLAVLGESSTGTVSQAGHDRFAQALRVARSKMTMPEELPLIERITKRHAALLEGQSDVTPALVADIRSLIAANRRAMTQIDREAQRLGNAGAWTSAFIALLTFVLSGIIVRRLQRRVVHPLVELHSVLESVRGGDRYRRCRPWEAPSEIRRVMGSVNLLLDAVSDPVHVHTADEAKPHQIERVALQHLLDANRRPQVVIDDAGKVLATNTAALQFLATGEGEEARIELVSAITNSIDPPEGTKIEKLEGMDAWLCTLRG